MCNELVVCIRIRSVGDSPGESANTTRFGFPTGRGPRTGMCVHPAPDLLCPVRVRLSRPAVASGCRVLTSSGHATRSGFLVAR
jgi:hypothetical protein